MLVFSTSSCFKYAIGAFILVILPGWLNCGSARAQLVGRDEARAQSLCQQAEAEANAGDYQSAKKHYVEANLYWPGNAKILIKLGDVEDKRGDLDEAIRRGRIAIQYEPEDANAHLHLASYLEKNQDLRGAELQYERTLDLYSKKSDPAPLYNKITSLLLDLDELEKADKLTKEWTGKHDESADCHYDRGLVFSRSEKPARLEESVKQFSKALLIEPRLSIAHYQLGLVLSKLDRKDEAREHLNRYILTKPSEAELKLAKQALDRLNAAGN
jgi:tetratricopeptide (TPR) repeat protein